MKKSMTHFIQRSLELGLLGMLERVWAHSIGRFVLFFKSLWWGWKSRREMSVLELLSHTTGNWNSMDDLFLHLANRPNSSFLLPHPSPHETRRVLEEFYSQHLVELLGSADAACRDEVSLLGRVFQYPNGIDWHVDPVTGWRWPLLYRDRMSQFIGSSRPVDLIVFWELNRHQHFIALGIAYWLTGKQCYVDTFIRQVKQWIADNPLCHGMNWYYPLEISIRLIAWTVAFQFFRTSPEFQQSAGRVFLTSLWQQADFLRHHLQPVRTKSDISNNHMMAELTGLILVGAAFPEFHDAKEWRETGLQLLAQQAGEQTHSDGVNLEQASGYHRFVAELLLLVVAWGHRGGKREPVLENTLERMLNYILFSTSPDGTNPMWGDTDFGRALGVGQEKDFWDFRPLLSAGAVLFKRSDWKHIAGRFDEEAFWLLGFDGMQQWDALRSQVPEHTSQGFPQGGHYIIRDDWSTDTDVAFFRCGSFGLGGEGHCAHAHCDLLSFNLWMKGEPLFVDSGTYVYHGPLRDYFRLSTAHNVVMIDDQNQAVPEPNFNWRRISNASCQSWSQNHITGVMRSSGLDFIRTLNHPRPGFWMLEDEFIGHGKHKFEWFFNFAPGLEVELNQDNTLSIKKDGRPFVLAFLPNNGLDFQLIGGFYSKQYCIKERNQKLCALWNGSLSEGGMMFQWRFELVNPEPAFKRGEYAAVTEE